MNRNVHVHPKPADNSHVNAVIVIDNLGRDRRAGAHSTRAVDNSG